jgi:cell division protein FtsB
MCAVRSGKAISKKEFSPAEHGAHVGDVFNRQRVENLERENAQLKALLTYQAEHIQELQSKVSEFGYETFQAICLENEQQFALIEQLEAEVDVEEKRFNQLADDYSAQSDLIEKLAESLKYITKPVCFCFGGCYECDPSNAPNIDETLAAYELWRESK